MTTTSQKIVIPGGSGYLGRNVAAYFVARGHQVVVLSRTAADEQAGVTTIAWDGRTLGSWAAELDGADIVINLAGRSVNCR
ncbi:MAG: NAD-dependent epimerase/dehydratase family protein, partial [Chloroflexi bacterium]|nr:NAD-dependent epimerase/dehydratase family protein [Chloroflexota bacterium]